MLGDLKILLQLEINGSESWKMTVNVKRKLHGVASKILGTITGRTIREETRNPTIKVVDEGAGQKMELAGTRPTHDRSTAWCAKSVKLRQTYSRDAFRRRTKPKY